MSNQAISKGPVTGFLKQLLVRCILFLAIVFVSVSCSQTSIYNDSIDVDAEEWHSDSLAVFNVNISDTAQYYNIFVNLRNTTVYKYQNIFFFIDVLAPNGACQRDTIECFITDNTGRWLGKGHGAFRDNRFFYRKAAKFASKGDYTFKIQQAMRDEKLKGIANVGIIVQEVQNN